MANLLSRLTSRPSDGESRFSLTDYVSWFSSSFGSGPMYPAMSMEGSKAEAPSSDFVGLVHGVARRNGVVAGAVFARSLLLSDVRFVFRGNLANSDPGKIVTGPGLDALNRPGPGLTRPTFMKRVEQHVSYAGNAYIHFGRTTRLLRPDWVTIALGSDLEPDNPSWAEDAEVLGYIYHPGGPHSGAQPRVLMPNEVAHWAPEPDPLAVYRGESWVLSVLREITADGQATDHQSKFFEHAATPQMVFTMDPTLTSGQIREYRDLVNEEHAGTRNAWKNLFLGGGADAKVVGAKLGEINLKDIQGGYEARIAMRSRIPAVALGLREGMQGSALNSGNYGQIRRLWADGWFSPTVHDFCATVDPFIAKPGDRDFDLDVWPDTSQVLFLQEDQKDAAEIAQTNSSAVRSLVEAGYEPDAAAEAVITGDFTKLIGGHTGTFSVQLQPPGSGESDAA